MGINVRNNCGSKRNGPEYARNHVNQLERSLLRVMRLEFGFTQWLKFNAVLVPPVIEIQLSHTLNFIKTLTDPQPPDGSQAAVRFPLIFYLTTGFTRGLGWVGNMERIEERGING